MKRVLYDGLLDMTCPMRDLPDPDAPLMMTPFMWNLLNNTLAIGVLRLDVARDIRFVRVALSSSFMKMSSKDFSLSPLSLSLCIY